MIRDSIVKDKKILFICPQFFNYEKEIKKELEQQGAEIDYFDERFGNDFFSKSIIRLNLKFFKTFLSNNYYLNILKKINNKNYDFIFFISPETITEKMLKKMKEKNKNSKFILYTWDSFLNKPSCKYLMKYFDKKYSFDKQDCKNTDIKFLPLFYLDKYNLKNENKNFKYDISFVGTAHEDRFFIINKLKENLKNQKLNSYFYLYLQSKKIYYFRKIFDKRFKNAEIENFHFDILNHKEIVKISNNSKIILDIQRDIQSGLTMRTIEIALGMRKKIVTTNKEIKEYDFYNENNILIIDRKKPFVQKEFFDKEYEMVDEEIYKKYSLKKWLENIFE
ncbi:hypothetical protein [Fusobacterium varium]|uniref:hypothetical protein n=1 Tax=Fusobacterium varium TaxID=856 RepID=UPI001F2374B1|nr:hypothetical protein [Fusobacterium varium]MCF2674471.1 hypothetical protein [Fusobacterium varium]